jgi:hypothetical protein
MGECVRYYHDLMIGVGETYVVSRMTFLSDVTTLILGEHIKFPYQMSDLEKIHIFEKVSLSGMTGQILLDSLG